MRPKRAQNALVRARPSRGGTRAGVELAEVFDRLAQRLVAEHPEDEQGRMLQSAGLKTSGKFYAFVTGGELVVKLPAGRVAELIASGAGRPCDPAGGRPMREWVRLSPSDQAACAAYLREGRLFVAASIAGVEGRSETEPRPRPPAQQKGRVK